MRCVSNKQRIYSCMKKEGKYTIVCVHNIIIASERIKKKEKQKKTLHIALIQEEKKKKKNKAHVLIVSIGAGVGVISRHVV